MDDIAVQKASEIETPARRWLQDLLGRSLSDNEQVIIFVAGVHGSPSPADRQHAFERMNRVLDRAAENMQHVPDAEFEAAVDEAMDQIRKRSD